LLKLAERKLLKQGFLIAIEGIDGAGKTTQSAFLEERLAKEGYPVIGLHEPTDGQYGKKIRELAKNGRHKTNPETEEEFFYLDRLEDVENNIRPALNDKKIVIMDRYYFSSVTYQGARGLNPDLIEKKNTKIAPKPHVAIILDLVPEVALQRIRQKRNEIQNHFERKKYLKRVTKIFLEKYSNRPNIEILNANDKRSFSAIASDIWKIVKPLIEKIEEK